MSKKIDSWDDAWQFTCIAIFAVFIGICMFAEPEPRPIKPPSRAKKVIKWAFEEPNDSRIDRFGKWLTGKPKEGEAR